MYFWNINQLVKDLRAGIVSEYEKMKYLLALFLFQSFALWILLFSERNSNLEILIATLFAAIEVGILIWGLYHCFVINKQNDNKNFIERFTCLSFPLTVKFFVFTLLGMLTISVVIAVISALITSGSGGINTGTTTVTINLADKTSHVITQGKNFGLRDGKILISFFRDFALSIISIIYYIILGRKIAEVAAKN